MLLAVSAIWGAAFPIIKYLVGFVSPLDLLVLRFVPTSIICGIWVALFQRKKVWAIYRRYPWIFLGLSVAWIIMYHMMLNVGETVLPAGVASLIIAIYPVFTIAFAAILRIERLTWLRGLGGLVALGGTALLTILGATREAELIHVTSGQWISFSLITLVAPITAAMTTLVTSHFLSGNNNGRERIDSYTMTLAYMAPSGVFALVFFRPELMVRLHTVPIGFWLALGGLVFFCTILSHFGWFWSLQHIEAGPAATSTYIIPIFSLAYARIWLGESITVSTVIAAATILAGIVIAESGDFRKRKPELEGEPH